MNKYLKGLVATVALFATSLGANAGVISCNMDSVTTSDYNLCMNLDVDSNELSLTAKNISTDELFDIGNLSMYDSDDLKFFTNNSEINESLSSAGDLSYNLDTQKLLRNDLRTSNLNELNHLNMSLTISDLLKDNILAGEGINYRLDFVNKNNNNYLGSDLGEGFYIQPEIKNVPEPTAFSIFALGFLGLRAARKVSSKSFSIGRGLNLPYRYL